MNQKPLNPWSLVAILCAIGLCPLFSIASILLGLRGIVEIQSRQDTRGLRLAWLAVALGTLISGFWIGSLAWWNFNVRAMINHGPVEAIIQGQGGLHQKFQEHFLINSTQTEISNFFQEVNSRYGTILSGSINPEMGNVSVDSSNLFLGLIPSDATLSYLLMTSDGASIPVFAKYQLFNENNESKQFVNRFAWIYMLDNKNGHLVYPVDATPEIPLQNEN